MAKPIKGCVFFRDHPAPKDFDMKGCKKVFFFGVAFVPENKNTSDVTYQISADGFDPEGKNEIKMRCINPQPPRENIQGWLFEDIMGTEYWLPKEKEQNK